MMTKTIAKTKSNGVGNVNAQLLAVANTITLPELHNWCAGVLEGAGQGKDIDKVYFISDLLRLWDDKNPMAKFDPFCNLEDPEDFIAGLGEGFVNAIKGYEDAGEVFAAFSVCHCKMLKLNALQMKVRA